MKTGGRTATCEFESRGFRSEKTGSSSNRKTPVPHTGDPGATPGESTDNTVLWPSGEGSSLTRSGSVVRVHPGLLWRCPDTPTGRATRLKPECLLTSRRLWVLMKQRLGRQLADHLGLEPGMLWVRLPPEPLANNTSSRSSQECSPRCQRGDRGFDSHPCY